MGGDDEVSLSGVKDSARCERRGGRVFAVVVGAEVEDCGRGGGVTPRDSVEGAEIAPGDAVWAREGALEGGGGRAAGAELASSPACRLE